jgi:hypothetical protein
VNQGDVYGGSTLIAQTGKDLVAAAVFNTDGPQANPSPLIMFSIHAHLVSPGATVYLVIFDTATLIADETLTAVHAKLIHHWVQVPSGDEPDWILTRGVPGERFFNGCAIQMSSSDFPTLTRPTATMWASLNYGQVL